MFISLNFFFPVVAILKWTSISICRWIQNSAQMKQKDFKFSMLQFGVKYSSGVGNHEIQYLQLT